MKLRTFVAVAAALTVGFLLIPGGPAHAEGEITALGWWTSTPTASAPEGGFTVGSSLDGPNSVAAVRFDLGQGVSALSFTATEAGGAGELAVIRACPATDGWTPAEGAPLEEAPEIDCTNSVRLTRAENGEWSGDLTALVTGRTGIVSIGLVAHGPGGDGPLSVAPSEVQFEAPSATGTPLFGSTPPTSDQANGPSGPATSAPSGPPPPAFTPPPPAGITVSPPTTALDLSEFDSGQEATPETVPSTTPFAEERALGTVTAADVGGGGDRPVGEAFLLVLLAALAGLAVGGVSKLKTMRVA